MKLNKAKAWRQHLLAAALMCAVAPAFTASFTYEGELSFSPHAGDLCTPLASESTFKITVFGRDDSGIGRFEGYIYGEKLIPVHFAGNGLNQLALSFPGESPQSHAHVMSLRSSGAGSFEGTAPALTLSTQLLGCAPLPAQIHFALSRAAPGSYAQVAELFQTDARATQAYAQGMKGEVKAAQATFIDALGVAAKSYGADSAPMVTYLLALAQLHEAAGTYAAALPLNRHASAICAKVFGSESLCNTVASVRLSQTLVDNGQLAEAESTVRSALASLNSHYGADNPLSGVGLNALGTILIYTGHYAEAEATLMQAQALNTRLLGADSARVGVSLNNLGVLYRFTGRYAKAEVAMRQALAIDQKALGPDNALVIINTLMLGQVLRISGQYKEAEPLFRQALATAQRVLGPERPDHPALGMCLAGLAELLRETGRYSEAEPLYRQALANAQKYLGANHPDVGTLSMLLGRLLRQMGRNDEALEQLKRAYRIGSISGNQLVTWRAPAELMQYYAGIHPARPALAIFYGKDAVNTLQRLRGNLTANDKEAQQSFVSAAEVGSVYHTLSDQLISAGRLAEAQQVLEMLKQKEYFDFIQRAADSNPLTTSASLTGPEPDWAKRYAQISGQLIKIAAAAAPLQSKGDARSSAENRELEAYEAQLDLANQKFDAVLVDIARNDASAASASARSHRSDAIQSTGTNFRHAIEDLGNEALLAQYIVQEDKVQIIVTTPSVILSHEALISRKDLNAMIFAFREVLGNPKLDPLPQAQALYQLLIGPIADDLRQSGAKTLVLSLDESLRYLPFAALHDGSHYLIDNQSVVMLTEAAQGSLKDAPQANWRVLGLGLTEAKPGFAALPNVKEELDGIVGPDGIEGKVLLDDQFTERALRDGVSARFAVIHIASHYQFTPGSSDNSFLLLGDGNSMTLTDFRRKLDLQHVDLVTLSACQTALGGGEDANGMEVEGLGAAAQQQGAKAVLASLWPVADKSTALLMQNLYRLHKDGNLSKALALQQAQLLLLHGPAAAASGGAVRGGHSVTAAASPKGAAFHADPNAPYAHPYFWAPFILIGNWR